MNENETYENENSSGRETFLNILKAAHNPLELSHFTQKTQDDFKQLAESINKPKMIELQTEADLLVLSKMLYKELNESPNLQDPNNDALNNTSEQKNFKKDLDLIDAFTDDIPVISVSHPNQWMSINICKDKTIVESWAEYTKPRIIYNDDFYVYLYRQAEFLLDRDVFFQIGQKGHEFLAELGIKLDYISRDEAYFEYSQKFLDKMFESKYFRFIK